MTSLKEPQTRRAPSAPQSSGFIGPRRHLRDDVVGGAFTVAFFLLVAVFVLVFVWQRQVLTAAAYDRVSGVAAVQEKRVDDFVSAGVTAARIAGTRPAVVDLLEDGSGSVDAASKVLGEFVKVSPDLEWVAIYDSDLNPFISTGEGPQILTRYLHQGLRGVAAGKIVPMGNGEGVHLVGVPIGPPADPIGVAIVAQSTDRLVDMAIDYTGLGTTGETVLAQKTDGGWAQFVVPLRFDAEAAFSAAELDPDVPVADVLRNGDRTSRAELDYRGVEVLSAGRRIDVTGWAMVVKIDTEEAMAPLRNMVATGFVVLILGSLIAGLLAWQMSKHIRRPILEMRDAAVEVARGNRDTVVPNARSDEIGELANSFNTMTAELNLLAGSLERQVADRTAELELRNNEMRDLIVAKETFLAGVSHEVRGPLTAMMGFLDLSRDDSLADVVDRGPMLDAAMTQAEEVLILIEDLLAAARAESGTLKLASVRVNLEAQIAQVVEGLPPDRLKSVTVTTSEAVALGDPSRARQVVRNLVTNAFRYGGPEIRIRAFTSGERAMVVVEDNGDGIALEDRAEIFDAYRQSSSGRQVSESVGLGLHVSKQLAELMSGRLDYKYEEGWSVFALDLPKYSEVGQT